LRGRTRSCVASLLFSDILLLRYSFSLSVRGGKGVFASGRHARCRSRRRASRVRCAVPRAAGTGIVATATALAGEACCETDDGDDSTRAGWRDVLLWRSLERGDIEGREWGAGWAHVEA
jgi:hypothetical protein